jgi:Skp family chaperone for outer membrane proteins
MFMGQCTDNLVPYPTIMKKHLIITASILLFCGGLFALHLAAQSVKTAPPTEEKIPLFDPRVEQCSERELLELKVKSYEKMLEQIENHAKAGTPLGRSQHLADARANLADAEAELYRHIGDTVKLQAALKAKVEAYREKLRAENNAFESGATRMDSVCTAEIQLLDALLEQKRIK